MAENEITAEQMTRAARIVERRMFVDWLAMITGVKAGLTLTRLTRFLSEGDIDGALRAATTGMATWFAQSWTPAYTASAERTALFLQRSLGVPMSFDIMSLGPIRHLQAHRLRLVTGFGVEQRAATMRALEGAFARGLNPRATARVFRGSIGLTENQVGWVQNYRRALEEGSSSALNRGLRDRRFDPTVRRSVESGEALSQQQIDRMVGRYTQKTLRYRSEVIARTESLRSTNGGQRDMFQQAIEEGDLRNDQLLREWNTAADERVRDSHSAMHAQEVEGLDNPFISGLGNQLLYPGDPGAPAEDTVQCRCAVGTRLVKILVAA